MSEDETSPRLLSGPKGSVLRLWERSNRARAGEGSVLLAAAQPQDAWRQLVEIRPPAKGITARDPDLAVGPSGELAIVYRWWQNQPRSKEIRLARSADDGKTWTQSSTALDTSGKSFDANVAWVRDRGLVAVWTDERRRDRAFDIYARRSPDAGATWGPEQLLSRFAHSLASDIYARPRLLADGQDRLWVVWVGVRRGRSALYLNRSTDGGRSWTEPVTLSGDSDSVFGQVLVRSGERLLLVWQDNQTGRDRLYAVSSSDAGVKWTSPVRVDHLPNDAITDATSASVLLSPNGEALVAWQDGRNGRDDIFLARSADGGQSWGTGDQRMDADEPGTAVSQYPKLAKASDGRVAVAWDDDRAGPEAIYLRVRSNGEKAEWGPETRVTTPGPKRGSRLPQLLWGSDGLLHVAWEVWDYALAPAHIGKQVGGKTLRLDRP